ncbi:heparan-alpha-glucosaminide N-acetyltransferase domain-containing protein [Chitinophaga sp. NPDC101104]|uniref:heparan-alpha-glucosaminide N-acetyltransferase domain-containing protein n=1 Tax=Chitinophaga sp. NPDC101104 TaxID=3390561 RepID=UPI003CFF9FAC
MTLSQRIASIDITRALTMTLMIFVNDLWTLHDIPLWLEHTKPREDGMGLADTVFPAFLFIVGMSIPYAVANRIKKGDGTWALVRHALERGIGLLVMGLVLVNGEYLNEGATGLSRGAWNAIACTSFILIWNQYPAGWPNVRKYVLKAIGIAGLLLLVSVCRGGEHAQGFSTYWWGILGLIGWAYLVGALTFILGKGKIGVVLGVWLVCMAFNMAAHGGLIAEDHPLRRFLAPVGDGGLAALVLGGTVASILFRDFVAKGRRIPVIGWLTGIAAGLLVAGLATRPIWGISKVMVTPSWVYICSAITLLVFTLVYWIADLKGKGDVFRIIRPAGTDTLLCYLMPYYAYALMGALSVPMMFPWGGVPGLLKSLTFALIIVQLTGWISKRGIRLKL